jgi:apolipoprotein D and lipocalin family protein
MVLFTSLERLLVFTSFQNFIYFGSSTVNTVKTLNLESYDGRWYQIYGNNFDQLFEKFASCITADYTIIPNGNVSVLNSQYEKNKIVQIEGYAYYSSTNKNPKLYPGQLTVHLDGVPRDSPYWIYDLGPVINNEYEWAIVSDPVMLSLFVLARDVNIFYEKYDNEVLSILDNYGFNDIVTVSHENCEYTPLYTSLRDYSQNLQTNVQSQCQIANYLRISGFPESSIGTMVCISKYESSYNCDAKNTNTDSSSDYGLLQINSYYWCSGDPLSKYNECGVSCSSLFNCQTNSNCAHKIWKQQGYNAWYGYKYHKTECDSYKVNC